MNDEHMLKRLDRAAAPSAHQALKAARHAGYQVEIVEDGDIRARAAADLVCDLRGAAAVPGWVSADNLERGGMHLLTTSRHSVYQPVSSAARTTVAAV